MDFKAFMHGVTCDATVCKYRLILLLRFAFGKSSLSRKRPIMDQI